MCVSNILGSSGSSSRLRTCCCCNAGCGRGRCLSDRGGPTPAGSCISCPVATPAACNPQTSMSGLHKSNAGGNCICHDSTYNCFNHACIVDQTSSYHNLASRNHFYLVLHQSSIFISAVYSSFCHAVCSASYSLLFSGLPCVMTDPLGFPSSRACSSVDFAAFSFLHKDTDLQLEARSTENKFTLHIDRFVRHQAY